MFHAYHELMKGDLKLLHVCLLCPWIWLHMLGRTRTRLHSDTWSLSTLLPRLIAMTNTIFETSFTYTDVSLWCRLHLQWQITLLYHSTFSKPLIFNLLYACREDGWHVNGNDATITNVHLVLLIDWLLKTIKPNIVVMPTIYMSQSKDISRHH